MKKYFKRPTNTQLIVVVIIASLLLPALFFTNRGDSSGKVDKSSSSKPQTVSGTAEAASGLKIGNQEKKQSSVCNKISKEAMAKIISETVTESVSSIPDTEASGTTVAGCSYAVKKVEGQKIQSILVVSRRLPDDDAAIQTFDRLTKKDATKIDNIADEAFLLSGKKQAIVRKGAAIVTINIIPVSEIENQADIVGSIISKL